MKITLAATALPLHFQSTVSSHQKGKKKKIHQTLVLSSFVYTIGSQSLLQPMIQLSHTNMLWLIHKDVMQHFVNGTDGTVPCYFEIEVFIVC